MSELHPIDLIPAYALDILDGEEAREVVDHLAACPACRQELAAYRQVMEQLPQAVPQVTPPARLKSALMEQITAPPQPQPPAPVRPVNPTRARGWWAGLFAARPAWAWAGLVVIFALLLSNLALWQQVRNLQGQRAEFRLVRLEATQAAPGASGVLMLSPGGEFGALIVDGLPDLPAGKQYQLWLIRSGQRTSGGVFSVLDNGYGVMQVSSPEPLSIYQSFGITIEPTGGSPGPTGERVLGGSL